MVAMIKIVAILAMIVTGIFMVLTGFETPHGVASLANITDNFSLFPNGGVNFVMAFQMVFFAYLMIEFIGVTTSETKNPRQVLPKAVKEIPLRIAFFLWWFSNCYYGYYSMERTSFSRFTIRYGI